MTAGRPVSGLVQLLYRSSIHQNSVPGQMGPLDLEDSKGGAMANSYSALLAPPKPGPDAFEPDEDSPLFCCIPAALPVGARVLR
ncbi:MAG: hypothetical protein Ct9H300mP14_04190 [Gammaproteobacteria bacterium]|nr:MAG: hypothetical protein Ct9H300mP14_04190 [Gammaproteobacteria bacterium]